MEILTGPRERTMGHRFLDATLHGLMMQPQGLALGEEARLIAIGEQNARHSTRLADSVREDAIIVSHDNSSSSITSASACGHATMLRSSKGLSR